MARSNRSLELDTILRTAPFALFSRLPVGGTSAISRVPYRERRTKIAFLNVKI